MDLASHSCVPMADNCQVIMYRFENWTTEKAEHQRNDTFQTVVLEKTLGSPLDSKEIEPKGNQP